MSWFFVDDGFYDHEKLGLLSPDERMAAIGLWTVAGAWSRKKLTGGNVPYHQVTHFGGTHEQAQSLVKCGLWELAECGYKFHSWSVWQETPEEVAHKRSEGKKRAQKWRDSKGKKPKKRNGVTRGELRANTERTNARVTHSVPGEGEGEGRSYGGDSQTYERGPDALRAARALSELRTVAGGGR